MYAVFPRITVYEVIVIVIGIHNPGKGQLFEIAEAGRTFALFTGPIQSGHQNSHQYGYDSYYNQKFYESESCFSAHTHLPFSTPKIIFKKHSSAKKLTERVGLSVMR
jgi:hypothetical protein